MASDLYPEHWRNTIDNPKHLCYIKKRTKNEHLFQEGKINEVFYRHSEGRRY